MMDKQQQYDDLLPAIGSLIEGEHEEMSVLANVAAVLKEHFGWFWVGFYLEREGELRLGPFQGSIACMHIAIGRGVCGTAFQRQESIVVDDVEQFPGHIACSSMSRSEIVVPVFDRKGKPVGVLDIDSTSLATFDDCDRRNLEAVTQLISQTLY